MNSDSQNNGSKEFQPWLKKLGQNPVTQVQSKMHYEYELSSLLCHSYFLLWRYISTLDGSHRNSIYEDLS